MRELEDEVNVPAPYHRTFHACFGPGGQRPELPRRGRGQ